MRNWLSAGRSLSLRHRAPRSGVVEGQRETGEQQYKDDPDRPQMHRRTFRLLGRSG